MKSRSNDENKYTKNPILNNQLAGRKEEKKLENREIPIHKQHRVQISPTNKKSETEYEHDEAALQVNTVLS